MGTERLKPGELIAGRYRMERVLGQGGMGIVVLAKHAQLGKRVALKILREEQARDPEQAARFSREAQTGVRLRGEHTVEVMDVGRLADGTPYIVMEFLVGKDLGEVLSERRALPISDAVDYILQACEGIAEAHAHGIIHRDLKPQNLFLGRRTDGSPLIKVLDFGLTKVVDNDKALTKSRTIFGSPYYMSPEQMKASRDVDGRTDIWALGVCLYELLTAHPPFEAPTVAELMVKVLQETPDPIRQFVPEVPQGLESAVLRCLEKAPVDRFQGIASLAAAIEPYASREVGATLRIQNIFDTALEDEPQSTPSFFHSGSHAVTRTDASYDSASGREGKGRRGLVAGLVSAVVVGTIGFGAVHLLSSSAAHPQITLEAPAAALAPSSIPPAMPSVSPPRAESDVAAEVTAIGASATVPAIADASPSPSASSAAHSPHTGPAPRQRPPRAKPGGASAAQPPPAAPPTSDPNDRF